MKQHVKRYAALSSALAILSLSGCATQGFREASNVVGSAQQAALHAKSPRGLAVASFDKTPWLLGKEVAPPKSNPAVLRTPVTLMTQTGWPLSKIVDYISKDTGVNVEVDPDLSYGGVLSVSVSGTLQDLLNQVANESQGHIYWKVLDDGSVFLFSTETREFEIPALNWKTQISNRITSATSTAGSSGGASSTSTSSGSAGSATNNGSGEISVKNTATTDVWKELKSTAQAIAGPQTKISADPSNSLLVVTGTPPEIERVSAWAHKLTTDLQKQVAVDIRVYSVQVKSEDNYGFNPSVVFNSLGQRYGFTLTGAPTPSISSGETPFSLGASVLSPSSGTPGQGWYGSSGVVQALSMLGKTSLMVSQTVVTLNGQPAPIQSAVQTNYLASSSTTPSVTSGIAPTTTLTPGSVTTGFTALVVPKVVNNRILLGLNLTLSDLLSLDSVTSNGASLETPKVSITAEEQSVSLKPGQTLMLTGFKQEGGSANDSGVGNPGFKALGGGKDSTTSHQVLVVLVTARVL